MSIVAYSSSQNWTLFSKQLRTYTQLQKILSDWNNAGSKEMSVSLILEASFDDIIEHGEADTLTISPEATWSQECSSSLGDYI